METQLNQEMTLSEAQDLLKNNSDKGTFCPCCGQFAKVYKRQIYHSVAIKLIGLYKMTLSDPYNEFFHAFDIQEISKVPGSTNNDLAGARYFGLIETQETTENKKNSGLWKLTQKGRAYVEGKLSIPHYVHLYNGKILGFSGSDRTIQQALRKNFDYNELMSR